MQGLFQFLASQNGRILRAVAGIALILVGLYGLGGTAGTIVALVGIAPLAAGVFDVCLFAPLFGYPFKGSDLRR